jgi:toxin ParE1/3/4
VITVYKTPQAKVDLLDCWFYIATENSPSVADKVLLKIETTLAMLTNNPDAGISRPELGRNLQSFPVSGYSLFYEYDKKQLNLIRMLHGSMDVGQHI